MTVVGVFDSGVGGLSVANAIKKARPDLEVRFVSDQEHVPYGNRPKAEIHDLAYPILKRMQDEGCQVIVVACNTVSTNVISELRQELKVPLIALEPMIKPAANLTKSKTIAVCATPATLSSSRYHWLKDEYAQGIKVLESDCSGWAEQIEHDEVDHAQIERTIEEVTKAGADVIVLGCTHYHRIEEEIKRLAGSKAVVIQPEEAIIRRLTQTLSPLV